MKKQATEQLMQKSFDKTIDYEKKTEGEETVETRGTLNSDYTFETFIAGENNNLVYHAALAVAKRPGTYNPLFLYGSRGLGKTHIMQAIGNYYIKNYPKGKIIYTTSENFSNEFILAIREHTNPNFRERYKNVDLLLVDDIQYIAKKEAIQEVLFHTISTLQLAGKQIVIASDRHPDEISNLDIALRGRLKSGVLMEFQPPDFKTRVEILKNKFYKENLTVNEEVLFFIANNFKSNVTELESAVKNIILYTSIMGSSNITMEIVNESLKNTLRNQSKHQKI